MRVQIVSDLHLESFRDPLSSLRSISKGPKGDVLIMAGDICPIYHLRKWQNAMEYLCKRYSHVIYTPGNHEHYGMELDYSKHFLKEASKSWHNLHLTWLGTKHLMGVDFLQSTLWYEDKPDCYIARHLVSDFSAIKGSNPSTFIKEGDKCKELIADKGADCSIWVTHHLPSPRSIGMRYRGATSNCFYLNDIEFLIERHQPQLIVHGHGHTSQEYRLGDTLVICNPRGYEDDLNPRFNPDLVIDL